jgi:hypothetical protein
LGITASLGCQKIRSFIASKNQQKTAAAADSLARVLCASDVLTKIISAYPQAQMTEEQLRSMKVSEGLEKAQAFSAALPGIITPVKAQIEKNQTAWNYIYSLSSRGAIEFKKRNWDPQFKLEWTEFAKQTEKQMLSICSGQFGDPQLKKYSEFAIGTILGFFGRK